MRVLSHIREVFREEGMQATCFRILKHVLRLLYYRENYLIYSKCIKNINNQYYYGNNQFLVIKNITDIENIPSDKIHALDSLKYELNNHIINGGMLFCVIVNKAIAHQSWVTTCSDNRIDPVSPFIKYDRAAYIGRCETASNFRGKGLYPQVLLAICGVLAEKGVEEALLTVLPDNHSSISGIKKAGFREKGRGRLDVLLGNCFWKEL